MTAFGPRRSASIPQGRLRRRLITIDVGDSALTSEIQEDIATQKCRFIRIHYPNLCHTTTFNNCRICFCHIQSEGFHEKLPTMYTHIFVLIILADLDDLNRNSIKRPSSTRDGAFARF